MKSYPQFINGDVMWHTDSVVRHRGDDFPAVNSFGGIYQAWHVAGKNIGLLVLLLWMTITGIIFLTILNIPMTNRYFGKDFIDSTQF